MIMIKIENFDRSVSLEREVIGENKCYHEIQRGRFSTRSNFQRKNSTIGSRAYFSDRAVNPEPSGLRKNCSHYNDQRGRISINTMFG